jgi:hypothetical protein
VNPTQDAWRKIAEHYQRLSTTRKSEGLGVQLACLVLAEYCVHLWTGDGGGPSLAMVAIAEHLVGERVDEVVASELTKISAERERARAQSLS